MTLDVAIIGGGPAGAAAALSLRQAAPGAAIAIFDRGDAGRWRSGEILAPGGAAILQSLGCWPAFLECGFLESVGTRAVWGSAQPYDNEFLFSLSGNGWRLDRVPFDRMMLDCAQRAGAAVHTDSTLLDSEPDGDRWRLHFRNTDCHARFVIDASGRNAAFATQRGAKSSPDDRLCAVIRRFHTGETADTLIEAAELGWWYSVSLPGAAMVAAFMTDIDLVRQYQLHRTDHWNDLLAQTSYTRERTRNATPQSSVTVRPAHSCRLNATGGEAWVAAGDAAMTFDPLSSQGIVKALRSGKLASFVAADFLRGIDSREKYERLASAEYAEYQKAREMYYEMELRWSTVFWQRRRGNAANGAASS